jgi:rhodanese-related sulfurtransferase
MAAAFMLAACAGQSTSVNGTAVKVPGGSYMNVPPSGLNQMLAAKDFVLINVHIPYAGELAQTDAFIPYTEIAQNLGRLPSDKNARIVLYCSSGHMSGIAANTLVQMGYTNIWNLDGGMIAWQSAGYPLQQNK